MLNVNAFAIRNEQTIEVTITGNLPNSCYRAVINDIYPGGDRVYVRDPGEAQVFIKEWQTTDSPFCAMIIMPWGATVTIPSAKNIVSIYVNGLQVTTVDVITQDDNYNVWELTGGIVPPNGSYSIFPASVGLHHPWTKQFGPANYKTCSEWVRQHENVGNLNLGGNEFPRGLSQGGSEAPRGFEGGGGGTVPRGNPTPRFVF